MRIISFAFLLFANLIYYYYISSNPNLDCTWVLLLLLPIWVCLLLREYVLNKRMKKIVGRVGVIGVFLLIVIIGLIHLWRSTKLAESVGFTQVQSVTAPVLKEYVLYNYVREIGTICREYLMIQYR